MDINLSSRWNDSLCQRKWTSVTEETSLSSCWKGFLWQMKWLSLPSNISSSPNRKVTWISDLKCWHDSTVQYIWVLYLQWDFAWTSFDQLLYWQQFDAKFLHIELRTFTSTDFLPGWPPFFALFASSYLARAKYANLNTSVNLQPCPQKTEQGFCKHPGLVSLSRR